MLAKNHVILAQMAAELEWVSSELMRLLISSLLFCRRLVIFEQRNKQATDFSFFNCIQSLTYIPFYTYPGIMSSRIPWVAPRNSYLSLFPTSSSLGRSCLNRIESTTSMTWLERCLMRESPEGKSECDQSKEPLILKEFKQKLQRTAFEAIYIAILSPTHSSQPIFS